MNNFNIEHINIDEFLKTLPTGVAVILPE